MLYIFKSAKYMKIIGFIAIVEVTTNMYYYGVQFSLEQIGTNFGTNILLTGCIEAIAYFSFSMFFVKVDLFVTKLPRKKGLFFFNVGSIILGMFFLFGFINSNKILASVLLCLCRYVNSTHLNNFSLLPRCRPTTPKRIIPRNPPVNRMGNNRRNQSVG